MHSVNEPSPDAAVRQYGGSGSLTYEPFYGLREKPFSLSADPRFLFRSPTHAPAFDDILAGIRRREGLIVLTGEIGTGKTTLCRSVLEQLDRRTFASFVADPFVSREDLLKTLLVDFGVISIGDLTRGRFNGASRSELSYPLYEFLDSLVPLQAFAVVVIDEAQNLSLPLLEEIRILSELERREKLLQVVLVGQPELRSNLRLPQMRQVDQRVSVRCELSALDAAGVAGYVSHRLNVAGAGASRAEFTAAALDALSRGSSGVPRLINRICDRALQRAHGARVSRIEAHFVRDAIQDLGLGLVPEVSEPVAVQEPSRPDEAPPTIAIAPATATPSTVSEPASVPVTSTILVFEPQVLTAKHSEATASPALEEFRAEADHAAAHAKSIVGTRTRRGWAAGAIAAGLVIACAGVPAWYLFGRPVDVNAVTAMVPARPTAASALAETMRFRFEPAPVERLQNDDVVPAAATPAAGGDYTIVVASFASRPRADRLVEELTTAGFRASVVERDWGPPRGKLVQVNVGGYASAIDVQRDLQQIRELPGGYTDARIVEQK